MNFWQKLPKPFFVLAPMADVTDAAFRRVIADCGKPDVMWTEFVSADGLILAHDEGKKKLLRDLLYSETERPIVAQLFGSNPETMQKAAELVASLGFDGLDINMGCPDKSIEKQGAGAAMIKNPSRAREIIRVAKAGVQAWADNNNTSPIPVSVKTRIGYNKNELETWIPELLAENPAVITVHARTRKEMSLVPARWEHVKRAVEIRNELQKDFKCKTLIVGNGDVKDIADAREKVKQTGANGVMFGRAIFGNPWLFAEPKSHANFPKTEKEIPIGDRLSVMLEHTDLFEELLGDIKSFAIMKKHYKAYVNGFPGSAELRNKLMNTNKYLDVQNVVADFLDKFYTKHTIDDEMVVSR